MKTTNHRAIRFGSGPISLLLSALAISGPGALRSNAAQTYTITDLGTLGGTNSQAYGINNSGQVVGTSLNGQTYQLLHCCHGCFETIYDAQHAFLWNPVAP